VQQPVKYETILKTGMALGLTIREQLLARANKVIE
jgi:hypothetical protein